MATDYGSDFSCIDDIDANLSTVSGQTCLAQALCRRLITPRGGLFYDPNYGTDIREFLNQPVDTDQIAQAVEAECLKDERVEDVRASVTTSGSDADKTIEIALSVTSAEGAFTFTFEISEDKTELFLEAA